MNYEETVEIFLRTVLKILDTITRIWYFSGLLIDK